jgi:hypothetical protein
MRCRCWEELRAATFRDLMQGVLVVVDFGYPACSAQSQSVFFQARRMPRPHVP